MLKWNSGRNIESEKKQGKLPMQKCLKGWWSVLKGWLLGDWQKMERETRNSNGKNLRKNRFYVHKFGANLHRNDGEQLCNCFNTVWSSSLFQRVVKCFVEFHTLTLIWEGLQHWALSCGTLTKLSKQVAAPDCTIWVSYISPIPPCDLIGQYPHTIFANDPERERRRRWTL